VPWEKGLKYLLKVWKVGRSFPEFVAAADLQFSRSSKEGGGGVIRVSLAPTMPATKDTIQHISVSGMRSHCY
jgi:hypothetical protein